MKAVFLFGLLEGKSVFLSARENNSGLSDTVEHRKPPESPVLCHQHADEYKVDLNLGPDVGPNETPLSSPKHEPSSASHPTKRMSKQSPT